jgi:hypothetical protein
VHGNATLLPYAFAGPTPGDAAFAGYFQKTIPAGLQRIWNAIDVVPHVWDTAHLRQLPTLYGIPPVTAVRDAVDVILPVIEHIGYTPLNDEAATFTGKQQNPTVTTIEQYMKELAYQHTTAYSVWAGINTWPKPTITM